MPDLSTRAVHQFWQQYHDKMIYRVVAFLEGVEHWTIDENPEFEAAMHELSQELDNISKVDMNQFGHEELLIDIANSIRSGRTLRLLQSIDSVHPGSASKLLIHAEETSHSPDDPPGLFLRRNIVFERLRLLARVFSQDRLNLVTRALEGDEHGHL